MATIRELPEQLTNQIAAGEVIERPSSVVKELVENAIDAKSSQIDIWVEEAGLKKIKVSDNGQGIHPDEVALAFERHATSKIYSREDLFRIHTLGFRGEALPSIASVSKVTVETATEHLPGKLLKIECGKIFEDKTFGSPKGTAITVESLFFNTPARLKYIRSLQTELSNITDIINRISLSHPEIAFRLYHDNNQLLRTSGNGDLKQAIAGVYGTKVARKMIEVQAEQLDFRVSGLVTMPEITRASRNYLTIILNGRYIRNFLLQNAIVDGFGSRLMVGRFPIAVINIETDPLLLDVNVHPSKKEVRISKEKELVALIISAIQEGLKDKTFIPSGFENVDFKRQPIEVEAKHEQTHIRFENPIEPMEASFQSVLKQTDYTDEEVVQEDFTVEEANQAINHTENESIDWIEPKMEYQPKIEPTFVRENHNEKSLKTAERTLKEEPVHHFPELYYFGQMHGTYLFAQNETGLYIVDQHAAQERIKYEYYKEEIAKVSRDLQSLLVPITIDLALDDYLRVKENQENLEEIGIFLEPFGKQTFLLDRHPTWFKAGQEEAILDDIIRMVLEDGHLSVKKLREATAIMMSCKRSIKANHHLNDHEARILLADLSKTTNPYNCPHGRPVLIHFTNNDMEKMFKRIQDPH
ncbi:DNA mismatch repair protein MutL [Jeotgalibaca sp. PTS2502]|uniref:DNA mismatch repair endonuclease MutL n=1 Tax=Jeotgalibaca sp. PTS2502 TaxID=1903686 RepID=UPI000973BEFF|nr:DNA mismatch repair endonuclease MutL [Jeotgalibaca sp. PTS2502]APZ48889.1 DNA mismatch repair protein MutL [Jeotgalibaca sp. PTS2502]